MCVRRIINFEDRIYIRVVNFEDQKFYKGKIQAMKYFFNSELPLTYHWGELVKNIDSTSFDTQADWF